MSNDLLIARNDRELSVLPLEGIRLKPIEEGDLTALGEAYWLTYLGSQDEMTRNEATEDIHAAWGGAYGTWCSEASLAAWQSGTLAGAVLTVENVPWSDAPRGPFIIDLFVIPAARRRGIGRALVCSALVAAGSSVALRVDDTAAEARSLYADLGFRPVR